MPIVSLFDVFNKKRKRGELLLFDLVIHFIIIIII